MKKLVMSAMAAGLIMAGVSASGVQAEGGTPPPPSTEWCSPGFWKNNPDQWVLPAGGLPASWFVEILSNPQKYARTGIYNQAADLLSLSHPDVDYRPGDPRVGNCPLSASASRK